MAGKVVLLDLQPIADTFLKYRRLFLLPGTDVLEYRRCRGCPAMISSQEDGLGEKKTLRMSTFIPR